MWKLVIGISHDHQKRRQIVHSNMYTKIYDIVNNTKKIVTPKFKAAFEAEYNPISYSNKTTYG